VGRDAPGAVSEQVLSIFKADTDRPQPAAKRVLQVMNPDIGQVSLNRGCLPSPGQHLFGGLAIFVKHMSCMPTSARLNNRAGHPIEHDEARLGVLTTSPGTMKTDVPSSGTATSRSQRSRQTSESLQPVLTSSKAMSAK